MSFDYNTDNVPFTGNETQTITVTCTTSSLWTPASPSPVVETETYTLSFLNPCADDTVVSLTAGSSAGTVNPTYDGSESWTMGAVTPSPAFCTTTQSCVSADTLACSDFEPAAGVVDFSLSSSDYTDGSIAPGTYSFSYQECVDDESSVCETVSLSVVIADPCDAPPTATIGTGVSNQNHFIGATSLNVTHDVITPDPSFCNMTYSYEITPTLGNGNTVISGDNTTRTITIDYTADLTPVDEGPFTVTVIGTVSSPYGNSNALTTANDTFTVTFDDPCADTSVVMVTGASDLAASTDHYISQVSQELSHSNFTLTTTLATDITSLCGDFNYTGYVNGTEVSTSTDPIAYNANNFTVDTNDTSLVGGTATILVKGDLSNYLLRGTTDSNSGTVSFLDSCDVLTNSTLGFSFNSTSQTDPTSADYVNVTSSTFTFTPFTVVPSHCESTITYTLTAVSGDDSNDYLSLFSSSCMLSSIGGTCALSAPGLAYTANTLPPQNYTFTITGTDQASNTQTATFVWEVTDPCADSSNIVITINEDAATTTGTDDDSSSET